MESRKEALKRRAFRVRRKLRSVNNGRFRLSVFRSNMHIYAQIIDDVEGHTLVSASSLDKDLRSKLKNGSNVSAAALVGELLAKRAAEKNIEGIVFDRGAYIYHGRIKALADAARDGGLHF